MAHRITGQQIKYRWIRKRLISIAGIFIVFLLSVATYSRAWAGDCDGTAGDDVVVCATDPTVPDAAVGLGLGDDDYTQNAGVDADFILGDGLEDGSPNIGDGGNDNITVYGDTLVVIGDATDGLGGDDTITIEGFTFGVAGDSSTGDGGNDLIVINGAAALVIGDQSDSHGGDDTIIINGLVEDVAGDDVDGDGGDDYILINGTVLFDVTGDCADGDGGDDTIEVRGSVEGDIVGDCVLGAGGNDSVILHTGSVVLGVIDGEDGFDTLSLHFLSAEEAAELNPAGDSVSHGGNTYTWLNFEQLIGLLVQKADELGLRIFLVTQELIAIEDEEGLGINFIVDGGQFLLPFVLLDGLEVGDPVAVAASPLLPGWSAEVVNTGVDPNNAAYQVYQVTVYQNGVALGSFLFSYW